MKWSKTKKAIEGLLADAVKDHVRFHVTRYGPGVSHTKARAWITWDKRELVNMSTSEWLIQTYALEREINAEEQAGDIAQGKGILSRLQFEESVEEYLSGSIQTVLRSDDPIIQAIAMFDRRVGKRRLARLRPGPTAHPLVRLFYDLRCKAEGIPEFSRAPNDGR